MATRSQPMTDDHKAALVEGRSQGRAVRAYLEALDTHRPKRGRRRSIESIQNRLAEIDDTIASASQMSRLHMVQERIDLTEAVAAAETTVDLTALEDDFAGSAKAYSERKGISYAAWREIGVPIALLKRAGIGRD